jgi:hypothetical protein
MRKIKQYKPISLATDHTPAPSKATATRWLRPLKPVPTIDG